MTVCAGHSAVGTCERKVKYVAAGVATCGVHLGWLVRFLVERNGVTVVRPIQEADGDA